MQQTEQAVDETVLEEFKSGLQSWLPESMGSLLCESCSSIHEPENLNAIGHADTLEGLLDLYRMDELANQCGIVALEHLGWRQWVIRQLLVEFCQRRRYGGKPVMPGYSAKKIEDRPKFLLCLQVMKDWKIERLPSWMEEEIAYAIYGQPEPPTAALSSGFNKQTIKNSPDYLREATIKIARDRLGVDGNLPYIQKLVSLAEDRACTSRTIGERISTAKEKLTPPARLEITSANSRWPDSVAMEMETIGTEWKSLTKLGDLFILKVTLEDLKTLLHIEQQAQ